MMNQFNAVLFSLENSVGSSRKDEEAREAKRFQSFFSNFLDQMLKSFLESKLDKRDLTKELEAGLFKLLLNAYNFGGSTALQTFGFNTPFSTITLKFKLKDKSILKELKKRAKKSASDIYNTTHSDLKFQSKAKKRESEKEAEVNSKKRLVKYITNSKSWRAFLIIRREFLFGFSLARWHVFKKSGATTKRWLRTSDKLTRGNHKKNQEVGWIGIDAKFPSGVLTPGIRDKDSFGCRCALDVKINNIKSKNVWLGS